MDEDGKTTTMSIPVSTNEGITEDADFVMEFSSQASDIDII